MSEYRCSYLCESFGACHELVGSLRDELSRLREENARLVKALQKIQDMTRVMHFISGNGVFEVADKALAAQFREKPQGEK